jgi:hypothetical protein
VPVFNKSWSPYDLGALRAWYDFGDRTTIFTDTARTTLVSADGQTIKGVTDKSGLGNHLSEGTVPPTFKDAIQGGRGISRFDSTDQLLGPSGATGSLAIHGPVTIIVVASLAAITDFHQMLAYQAGPATNNAYELRTDSVATPSLNWVDADAATPESEAATAVSPTGVFRVFVARRTAATLDFFDNGSSVGSSAHTKVPTSISTSQLYVGNRQAGLANNLDMAQALIVEGALGTDDLEQLNSYLANVLSLSFAQPVRNPAWVMDSPGGEGTRSPGKSMAPPEGPSLPRGPDRFVTKVIK